MLLAQVRYRKLSRNNMAKPNLDGRKELAYRILEQVRHEVHTMVLEHGDKGSCPGDHC